MENIKDLTKQLDSEPDDKSMRAWFINGSNSDKLKDNEVIHPTKTFDELVARALKIEKQELRKQESDSSASDSTKSSSSKSSSSDEKAKKKKSTKKPSKKSEMIAQLIKQVEQLIAQRTKEPAKAEKWCVKC